MAILSFFDNEFKLSDKKFSKLTMDEANMTDWVCLESPGSANEVMHDILGLGWRDLPFKSLCEILELRFGDTFHDKEEVFDYDTWNMLFFLGKNLTKDQKDFLRQHNFLPHRYASLKEEMQDIEKELKRLNISLKEYRDASQDDIAAETDEKIGELERRKISLDLKMKKWEKEHPGGGNPADANEYLSTFLELKEWFDRNQNSAMGRTQMYSIITQQMKSALTQAKNGREADKYLEFGHYEERVRRQKERKKKEDAENGKGGWFGFGRKKQSPEGPKPPKDSKPAPPPLITNTVATSSKAPKKEPLVQTQEPATSFTPKQEPVKVDTKVKFEQPEVQVQEPPKPAPEIRKLKQNDGESPLSDYDRIQQRVMEKRSQSAKTTNSSSKSRIIVIGIIAVAALIALLLLL